MNRPSKQKIGGLLTGAAIVAASFLGSGTAAAKTPAEPTPRPGSTSAHPGNEGSNDGPAPSSFRPRR